MQEFINRLDSAIVSTLKELFIRVNPIINYRARKQSYVYVDIFLQVAAIGFLHLFLLQA